MKLLASVLVAPQWQSSTYCARQQGRAVKTKNGRGILAPKPEASWLLALTTRDYTRLHKGHVEELRVTAQDVVLGPADNRIKNACAALGDVELLRCLGRDAEQYWNEFGIGRLMVVS